MATDYTITTSVKNKTTGSSTSTSATLSDQGDYEDSGIWNVGTSEGSHTISTDLVNVLGVEVENLASANYVQLGYSTGVYVHRLPAGMGAFIPLEPGETQVFYLSNTAASPVRYRFIEAA